MSSFDELYDLVMESYVRNVDTGRRRVSVTNTTGKSPRDKYKDRRMSDDETSNIYVYNFNPIYKDFTSRKFKSATIKNTTDKSTLKDRIEIQHQERLINSIDARFKEAEEYADFLKSRAVDAFLSLFAISGALIKLTKDKKKKKRIKEITNELNSIKKALSDGEISEEDAKNKMKVCRLELKNILKSEKKVLKEIKKAEKRAMKESVLLDIYESERNGDITEEERDMLLQMIS